MASDESQEQGRGHQKGTKEREKDTSFFPTLMDLCQLKNSELEHKFQIKNGRVVLLGDVVKDDSGSFAVSTEQGSSASQSAPRKFWAFLARLPGWAGQASDAISAYARIKMEDAPTLQELPESGSSTTSKMAKNMAKY